MKQILESRGWVMYHDCDACGHKQYFTNPKKKFYEVRTRVRTQTFSILLDNRVIGGPFNAYLLTSKLNEYGL